MKSIHNPFRSTATRCAAIVFACFTVLHTNAHAATVDTTGTTVNYTAAQNILDTTWIGNGTLNFNGSGTIGLDNSGGGHPDFINMTGGSITVQSGVTLQNGGWQGGVWTNNLASMAVASGATLDLWDGNPVRVDALTGAGTVTISSALGVNWAGSRSLVLGVNGGSGTFTGSIAGNSAVDGGSLSLTKEGTGTQTLTGANTYTGTTTVNGGTLELKYANSANGTLAIGSNITVNSGGTLLANAFNALGYTNHGGDTLQVNEGGTLKVGAGQVVSMPYNLNVVGGSLTSADAGYPGFGTFYLGGGTQTFTSSAGGTASLISAQNVSLAASTVTFTVNDGPGAVDLNVTGTLIGNGLQKNGGGTMVLSGANSYSGQTDIQQGTLRIQNSSGLGVGGFDGNTMTFVRDGATLEIDGSLSIDEHMHLYGAGVGGNGALRVLSGNSTLKTAIAFITTATINVAGGASLTQSNQFYYVGGLTKTGNGTLTLTGANTYSGATTIKAGIVFVNYDTGGSVSSSTITVDGTGSSNSSSYMIWAGNGATLANNFVLNSMGPEQLRGAINQDGGAGLVTLNGSITLAGNSRIGVGGGSWNSMVINGQVTGGGKLFVYESPFASPSTQLTLTSGANNYSGGTEIEQGRLSISNAASLGTGAVTITGTDSQLLLDEVSGTIPNNFTLGGGGNPGSTNYGYGNGTMVFHNDGQTATFSGTVTLSGDAKLRGYSAGGTTNFSNPIGGTGNLTFEAGGAIPGHTQYWGLGGSASTFTGSVLVRGDGSANSYLTLNGGALPSGTVLTLEDQSFVGGNNAVFDLNGNSQTLAGLNRVAGAGGLGSFVTNSGGSQSTLTINGSADSSFSGVIGVNTAAGATGQSAGGNNIALVKSGSATFTLSGANTYTGATTVNGGTLALGASDILPNGTQITIGTASLDAATFTDTVGTLAVSGSGVIHLGSGAALAFADSHLLSWSGTLTLTGTYVSGSSLRFGTGATGLTAGQLAKITKPGGGAVALDSSGFLVDSTSGYASWKAINAPTGTPGADYDGDGVSNGVEYVLGGTKDTNDLSKLPAVSISGANLVFTFQRSQASIDGTTSVAIQVGTNLSTWPDSYNVPGTAQANNPGVTVLKNTSVGYDTVTLTVPRAPDAKKFARLVVTPAP